MKFTTHFFLSMLATTGIVVFLWWPALFCFTLNLGWPHMFIAQMTWFMMIGIFALVFRVLERER